MSKSIRFLGIAMLCWAGVRAVSLGMVPGMDALAFDVGAARRRPPPLPALQPSLLPMIEPLEPSPQIGAYGQIGASQAIPYPAVQPYPIYVPVSVNAPMRGPSPQVIYVTPPQAVARHLNVFGSALPAPAESAARTTAVAALAPQITPALEMGGSSPGKIDRLSLSSWALMRDKSGPDSLANSGTLGGSEAGARLMWRFDPQLAATLRTSAPINSQRGMEAAIGMRYQPLTSWPIAFTLERRHGFRDYGRNAFALFAETGVYGQPMPWDARLDGYFQAGVVDFNNPDWFADGQVAVSRPVWRNVSAGFGAWGGGQPGLRRLDVGPRLSIKVGTRTRAHLDYRLNVVGNAQPGSGATATLAGDF